MDIERWSFSNDELLGRYAGRTVITSRTHGAPHRITTYILRRSAVRYGHIVHLRIKFSPHISFPCGSYPRASSWFYGVLQHPSWYTGNDTATLPAATRNIHSTLICGTAFLIKIMPITSGPPSLDLHLRSTSGLHSETPVHRMYCSQKILHVRLVLYHLTSCLVTAFLFLLSSICCPPLAMSSFLRSPSTSTHISQELNESNQSYNSVRSLILIRHKMSYFH